MRHNLRQICWWLTTVVVQHSNFEVVKIAEVFSDDVTKIVILASSTITFSSCALLFSEMIERKRRHSVWVRGHLQSCDKHGAYKCLVRDLEVHAEESWKKYISHVTKCSLRLVRCCRLV